MILSIFKLAGAVEHRTMARIGATIIATTPWRAAHVRATTYALMGWGFDIAMGIPSLSVISRISYASHRLALHANKKAQRIFPSLGQIFRQG
jgi:hypothetical protein